METIKNIWNKSKSWLKIAMVIILLGVLGLLIHILKLPIKGLISWVRKLLPSQTSSNNVKATGVKTSVDIKYTVPKEDTVLQNKVAEAKTNIDKSIATIDSILAAWEKVKNK